MSDPMVEIRASFFVECEELLEGLQDALSIMEDNGGNEETINVVFRAVHSIKGGAGAFGLDALVAFAHRFETVMDALRSGAIELNPDLVANFFKAADMLSDFVVAARDEINPPEGAEDLLLLMEHYLGDVPTPEAEESIDFTPAVLTIDLDEDEGGGEIDVAPLKVWEITLTPKAGFYESGNDALMLLRALSKTGDSIVNCILNPTESGQEALSPEAAEKPRLQWNVLVRSNETYEELSRIFDFVEDVCHIDISESQIDHFNAQESHKKAKIESFVSSKKKLAADKSNGVDYETDEAKESNIATSQNSDANLPPNAQGSDHVCETLSKNFLEKEGADNPSVDIKTSEPSKASTTQPKSPTRETDTAQPKPTVRVDLERIDRLVNLIGELVINQAMLSQSFSDSKQEATPEILSGLDDFMNLTRDIQDSVMTIRAQPVKSLFQRMSRIVRESASAIGKDVRMTTYGETTEIDKTVLEGLVDPLTHMIRNAVDHGLETAERRANSGKAKTGAITLSASHKGGRVIVEVEDDGQGINRKKVLSIAKDKGLVSLDAQLSETEIDNLLFLPGFSTAKEVSALSGRGVGMDVVKSSIGALGGKISISSTEGKGSVFSISLPLTLAVLDGMIIQVAGQTLVVPITSVIETSRLDNHTRETIGASDQLIKIRDDVLPLLDLAACLEFERSPESTPPQIVLQTISDDGTRQAFIVDGIMDQRQVVIKGLGDHFNDIPGVAAATILGNGEIALILDPSGIQVEPRNKTPMSISERNV